VFLAYEISKLSAGLNNLSDLSAEAELKALGKRLTLATALTVLIFHLQKTATSKLVSPRVHQVWDLVSKRRFYRRRIKLLVVLFFPSVPANTFHKIKFWIAH
jgi:hypothetical protein